MLVVDDGDGHASSRPRPSVWVKVGLALVWLAFLAPRIKDAESLIVTWSATIGAVAVAGRLFPRRRTMRTAQPSNLEDSPTGTPSDHAKERAGGEAHGCAPACDAASGDEHRHAARGQLAPPAAHLAARPSARPDRPTDADGVSTGALPAAVMTGDEVAAFLRVDLELVVAAIRSGQLPGNELGGQWRVFGPSLQRWLDGNAPRT